MLEVRGLTRCYTRIPAVDDVSFTIRPGEVLGYLGPNGSGKTTTVNMLAGLLEPTQGQVLFEGRRIHDDLTAYKRRLGYVPEEAHLYPYLSGLEYLQLVGRLRSIPERLLERKSSEFLRLLGLYGFRYTEIGAYSKGMKQKLMIAAALLHDPDVVIFDEPLSGLDVTSALVFRRMVHELAAQGKTILYSSHVLETVEKVCSTVIILSRGRIVAHDSVARLRELMAVPSLEEVFAQLVIEDDTESIAAGMMAAMKAAPDSDSLESGKPESAKPARPS